MRTKQLESAIGIALGETHQGAPFSISIDDKPYRPAMRTDAFHGFKRTIVFLDDGSLEEVHQTARVQLIEYDDFSWRNV